MGAITAIWMACSALSHYDIKKMMAALTAATSGLMFVACGMQCYSLAVLYFICHAFYKTMLFLSYTYLISATSGEINILKMGGLSKFAPKINYMILISVAAAIGFPFLPGFFAKISFTDSIHIANATPILIITTSANILIMAAMFRLVFVSMYGETRMDDLTLARVINSNKYDTRPFWILLLLSIIATYYSWMIYSAGLLNFSGTTEVTHSRDIYEYFTESIKEAFYICCALFISLITTKYSRIKLNTKSTELCIAIFRKDQLYEKACNYIHHTIDKVMLFGHSFNTEIAKILQKKFFAIMYMLEKKIDRKHCENLCTHVTWSFCGLLVILAAILLGTQ
jgi:NADH:ubiquinone oxidoreductase subunit 5 (subunit L)/multisubunit Na+/H+ antiporter MnhA subunit